MRLRPTLIALVSLVLGIVLVTLLLHVAKIDLRLSFRQLRSVSVSAFAKLVLLNIAVVFLSTEKWRKVDLALRTGADTVPSRTAAFSFTSIGMALGLIVPVQLGMSAARTFGTYFYGKPLRRGTAGTLFEQSFDLILVFFLATASAVTWFWHGHALIFWGCSLVVLVCAFVTVGPAMRLTRRLAKFCAQVLRPNNRIGVSLIKLSELEQSGLLSRELGRQLLLFSAARFLAVVLMAKVTAEAIGAPIALWQMAAMVPFSVVAMALALTPGAIGVNELACVSALTLLGSPLSVAAPWAVANRILATASCFVVAALAGTALAVQQRCLSKSNARAVPARP